MTTTTWTERTTKTVAATSPRTNGWIDTLVRTDRDAATTILRIALGAVMFPHAAQKVFGWFGGFGIDGTMGFLTGMGLPVIVAALVIAFEFFGSLALLTGAAGRLGALAIGTVMTGAVLSTHVQNGFFMNWTGAQAGEGFEYHLLALAMATAVLVKGSGALSVDRLLMKHSKRA